MATVIMDQPSWTSHHGPAPSGLFCRFVGDFLPEGCTGTNACRITLIPLLLRKKTPGWISLQIHRKILIYVVHTQQGHHTVSHTMGYGWIRPLDCPGSANCIVPQNTSSVYIGPLLHENHSIIRLPD